MSLFYIFRRLFYLAFCVTAAVLFVRAFQAGTEVSWWAGLATGLFIAGAWVSAIELWQCLRYSLK